MNLFYAEIIDTFTDAGEQRFARIRVGGAIRSIPLDLLPEAGAGDTVLLCDGVAISKVDAGAGSSPAQREDRP